MKKSNTRISNNSISLKKKNDIKNNLNNINLPIIEKNKGGQIKANNKLYNNNQNPNNSTLSLLSQSSIKTKSINNNLEEKNKGKALNNTQKINDIINSVNKNHNINSPIINKDKNIPIAIESINKNNINNNNNNKNNNSKPKYKFKSPKRMMNVNLDIDSTLKKEVEKNVPRITKEKLKEIQEKRKKRLIQEKKEYELQQKMFEEMKENSLNKKTDILYSSKINSPIEMSHKKAQHILEEGGMIDAYKHLIEHLCKNGLPSGNLYEYSSDIIKNYEKEWKKKKAKLLNEKIEKHFENKKKIYLNKINNEANENNLNKSNDNLIYQVLKRREEEQFIKKLDKSRSTLHIIKRLPEIEKIDNINKKEDKKEDKKESNNENNNNKIIDDKNKNNINDNNITKRLTKDNNILNNNKEIKYIKQNFNEKKVYFNIKIKNNEVEIKENENSNERDRNIDSNNSNNLNNLSKKNEKEENKKGKKGKRQSAIAFKRENNKLNSTIDILKNVNSSNNIKNGIKNEMNNFNKNLDSIDEGSIKNIKIFSKKKKEKK